MTASCGASTPNVYCGCPNHQTWVRENPDHPDVIADRARTIAWMAEHPNRNPATGHPMPHPDDYLQAVYGRGATRRELWDMDIQA
jgi:hypothetical protein